MIDYFEQFWSLYPNKKGKGAARKAFEKVMQGNDEVALFSDLTLALEAQKRYRQEAKGHDEFIAPWKHPSTWLNQECWLDEIGSHSDLKQRDELAKCSVTGCDSEVHGQQFDRCAYHLEFDERDHLRDVLMAPELRAYYNAHPEIQGLKGEAAVAWMKKKIKEIVSRGHD